MALGGGSFTTQNKILPGAYINFVSAARASVLLSERGYVAMPLFMDWGPAETVFTLKAEDFYKKSLELFGYEYTHDAVKGIRDLFKNARVLYGYRMNGSGARAACDYGTARYPGIRGNDLRMVVRKEGEQFLVKTFLNEKEVDSQSVGSASDLMDRPFVVFRKDAALSETAGMPFVGGENTEPSFEDYEKFLNRIESYSFHALGLLSDEEAEKKLFADFTRRMRDEQGIKFQTVMYHYPADYEGVISLENHVADSAAAGSGIVGTSAVGRNGLGLIYWTTGAAAGCAVNASNTNKTYDGEYEVDTDYTQSQLGEAIQKGAYVFHKVGDEVRVLEDINTLTTFTEDKGEDFQSNQTMRVLDQAGNDIAALFNNKYLGKIPNDDAGRISFWNDVVTYYRQLETIRAIEGFESDNIVVARGEGKKSVVASCSVTPVNAMSQLYMTVIVQ